MGILSSLSLSPFPAQFLELSSLRVLERVGFAPGERVGRRGILLSCEHRQHRYKLSATRLDVAEVQRELRSIPARIKDHIAPSDENTKN
jgi:hypothetical protein